MLRTVGLIVGFCAVSSALLPRTAAACSIALPAPFQVDPDQQRIDDTPPTTFTEITATTHRVAGTHCSGGSCSASSCGDGASLELTFKPPQDDQNAVTELGYRVLWLRGSPPPSMQAAIDTIQPLQSATQISVSFGYDEITSLDGELMLIAVDRAGNESPASAPVHVEFSGCTQYFDKEGCIGSGCSAARVLGGSTSTAWWWAPLSGLVCMARVRFRRRRQCGGSQ